MPARMSVTGQPGSPPGWRDYGLAAALAAVAVACRAVAETVAPGIGYFVILLPAVVLSGVFCGTAPAIVAATGGGLALSALFLRPSLLAWPPFNAVQLDALLFLPACATVIWATHAARRAGLGAAAAEARLAEVFRQIPGAVALLEAPDGRLVLRSEQSEDVLGHAYPSMRQTDDLAAYGGVHPDGRPYAAGDYPIARALRTGEIVPGERVRYRRPDQRLVDLEVHAGPVRDRDGRIVAAVGMAFDITDRVETERKLRDSEARYRALAEQLGTALDAGALGVWELDLATDRVRLDAKLAAMLGLPPEPIEMPRERFADAVNWLDRPRAASVLAEAVAAQGAYADEFRIRDADGTVRWFVTRGAVLSDMRKVVGVITEVTERRAREEALQAALQARDLLMQEADHRIKNSLQLVAAVLRLQLRKVTEPEAKQALTDAIARVGAVGEAHRALQRSPDLRRIEIARMLEDLCRNVGALNPAVTVSCDAAEGIWLDAEQAIPLGLIVSELLTNALRHAFRPDTPGWVRVAARACDNALEMTIDDDGSGMDAARQEGGLGSTIVAGLARQIEATVATESQPERGTTVSLRLKLPARAV